jgi:hypothetical protein
MPASIPLLLTGKIEVVEKANTHKNVYGQLIEYNSQLSLSIESFNTEKEIIEELYSRRNHKFNVNITGFSHKLIIEDINITVLVNRDYPKNPHSITIKAITNGQDVIVIDESELLLDLQADSLPDGIVSLWQDESGLSNHFNNNGNVVKTADGVAFDGLGGFMELTTDNDDFNFTDGNGNDTPYTIIVVAEQPEARGLNAIFWSNNSDNYFCWYDITIIMMKNYALGASAHLEASIDYSEIDTVRVVSMVYNGSMILGGMNIYIDGVKQTLTHEDENAYTGMIGGVRKPVIGKWNSNFFKGTIKALKVYKRELTELEIIDQYNYLKARYGL